MSHFPFYKTTFSIFTTKGHASLKLPVLCQFYLTFRHVSTTNIDELSGGDSCLYRSEESLPGAMGREEGQMIGDEGERGYRGHHHHHRHSSTFMTGRAISCSDLLLDLNDGPKVTKFNNSFRQHIYRIAGNIGRN